MSEHKELIISSADQLLQPTTRRRFLGLMGAAGTVVLLPSVFTACDNNDVTNPDASAFVLNLGSDRGILNYAYALEQLEAAFYTAAIASTAFGTLSANEQEVLSDLQKHEVIHREFLRTVLASNGIPDLAFNSTTVASLMADRATLLKTSQQLEDTGVSAYNGAGKYLTVAENLLLAGKIVSVEARHAAAIRDIRDTTGRLFAGDDVVDKTSGLDVKAEPDAVLAAVTSLNVITSPLSRGSAPVGTATPDKPAPTPT